jgi:hypothetical protein
VEQAQPLEAELLPALQPAVALLADCSVEIDRVPVNDGGGDEAQARRTEALVFEGAVSNFPLTVKEYRAAQRVSLGASASSAGASALGARKAVDWLIFWRTVSRAWTSINIAAT